MDSIAEIPIKKLDKSCENLTPIRLPKKPDIKELTKGKNKIIYSTLAFQRTYFFNLNRAFVFKINYNYC